MLFSEHYNLTLTASDDWIDPYLPTDSKLFVDPFLIYEDPSRLWRTAHDHLLEFFEAVFGLVYDARGDEKSLPWKKAASLLRFPEPREFCLGLAQTSTDGSGSGKVLQEMMLESVKIAVGHGIDNISHMETLVLFQGGMGLDRISDVACNVLKSYFIQYTQAVCKRHAVPTQEFRVKNAGWSKANLCWLDRDVELPANPYYKDRPVLLVPKRFVKDIPVVDPDKFWDFAWSNHGEELRNNFNYDIARNVDRWTKAKLARQNPERSFASIWPNLRTFPTSLIPSIKIRNCSPAGTRQDRKSSLVARLPSCRSTPRSFRASSSQC